MTAPDPWTLLETLTAELIGAGWTRLPDLPPLADEPTYLSIRQLADPTGILRVHAICGPRLNTELARLDADGADGSVTTWSAETGALPARVILAAARAAHATGDASAATALRTAGWSRQEINDGTHWTEQRWSSPDRTRQVSWFPPDPPFAAAQWKIHRSDAHNEATELEACEHTPEPVIAALALTD